MAKTSDTDARREAFRAFMARENLTVPALSRMSEVPKTTLYSYLDGKSAALNGSTEQKIARATGFSVDEIFNAEGSFAPDMKEENLWLKEQFEKTGKAQRGLAKLLGLDPSAVNRMVKGERLVKAHELRLARAYFESEDSDEHMGTLPELPEMSLSRDMVAIPEYDVRASAGDGFVIVAETQKGIWPFSRDYISHELRLPISQLVIIEVIGDSMEPTLRSGDRVLVNLGDRRVSQPGIFILWDGDGTVVKRLELVPGSAPQKLLRISDNPLHRTFEVLAEETNIVGRVVWFARRM